MRPLVLRSAIVAAVGGLIFGFDTAVISGAEEQIQQVFALDDLMLGLTVTTALIGTIVGALSAGRPSDRYGRKAMLWVIGVLYLVSAIGCALAPNVELLMLFRFLGGLGVGASSVTAPVYTAEIAPAKHRGRLVGLVQFNIVLGILVAYGSNAIIRALVHDETAWRWMLGVMAIPSVIFLVLLATVPETPRWLAANGRWEESITTTGRLTMTPAEAKTQTDEIRLSLEASENAPSVPFFTRGHSKVIMLAVAIAFFNQMSGINAILYYAPRVMQEAGATADAAFLMSIGVGAMNLIATMAALTVIDRIGRRTLMIVGSIGYLVSLGFLTAVMFTFEASPTGFDGTSSVLVLVGLMVFIAAHAFGQGSVIWVFISEIFPNRIRGRGQSLGSLTHWVFAAATSFAFPPIIGAFGGGWAFCIFFVAMIFQLVWVLRVMPETKGVPLEEMEARLGLTHANDGRADPLAAAPGGH